MNRFLVAANWKMNKTSTETAEFLREFKEKFQARDHRDIIFFPTALSLSQFQEAHLPSPIAYGGQNCLSQPSGAFTGEISAPLLASYGCQFCLVGHSERRTLFGETDADVAKKVKAIQEAGLIPMVCIGETEKQRLAKETLAVVQRQMTEALALALTDKPIAFAYEPVWAIGTGLVPTVAEIAEVHTFLRQLLVQKRGNSGENIPLLYGGSVNSQNARDIDSVKEVNGFLIGGASLKVASLLEIYSI